ncbi:hypothetical protein BFP70_09955 [Thioclava sp. SK-1]|nr:hypothetical protein BFP70_09955 [Thioclava sp. SK-1]
MHFKLKTGAQAKFWPCLIEILIKKIAKSVHLHKMKSQCMHFVFLIEWSLDRLLIACIELCQHEPTQ